MNVLQSLFQSAVEPETQQSPHVGEVFHMWSYLVELGESEASLRLFLNHTNDKDLKELIEHFMADVILPQKKQLQELMDNDGISPAPVTQLPAKCDEAAIPPAAKFVDAQIAQYLVVKAQGLLLYGFRGLSMSLRDDIGKMWLNFFHHVLAQSYTLKQTMRRRGWLKVPPLYYASPRSQQKP